MSKYFIPQNSVELIGKSVEENASQSMDNNFFSELHHAIEHQLTVEILKLDYKMVSNKLCEFVYEENENKRVKFTFLFFDGSSFSCTCKKIKRSDYYFKFYIEVDDDQRLENENLIRVVIMDEKRPKINMRAVVVENMKHYVLPKDKESYVIEAFKPSSRKIFDPFFCEDIVSAIDKQTKVHFLNDIGLNSDLSIKYAILQLFEGKQNYIFVLSDNSTLKIDFLKLEHNENDPKLRTYYLYNENNEVTRVRFEEN